MERDALKEVRDAREAARRVFERDAPDESVNLVAEREQVLGQIAAVLSRDAGDESLLGQSLVLPSVRYGLKSATDATT